MPWTRRLSPLSVIPATSLYFVPSSPAGRAGPADSPDLALAGGIPQLLPQLLSHVIQILRAAHGLPNVTLHGMRHTSGTLLLTSATLGAGDVDINTVKQRLGHSKITTTERYLHSIKSADELAAKALETILPVPPVLRQIDDEVLICPAKDE